MAHSHSHPNIIFEGNAGAYQSRALEGTQLYLFAPSLVHIHNTWMGVTDNGKHSSLLWYCKKSVKRFIVHRSLSKYEPG